MVEQVLLGLVVVAPGDLTVEDLRGLTFYELQEGRQCQPPGTR